jgi:hypothetical protein
MTIVARDALDKLLFSPIGVYISEDDTLEFIIVKSLFLTDRLKGNLVGQKEKTESKK